MKTTYVGSSLIVFLVVLSPLTPVMASVGVDAWRQGTPTLDPLMQQQIQRAVERELESKGLTQVDHTPDLYVVTHTSTRLERRVDVNELGYSGFLWRRRGDRYPPTTQIYYIPTATFGVDVLDSVSRRPVWRSLTIEYLRDSSEKNAKRIENTVRKIFKKFPSKEVEIVGLRPVNRLTGAGMPRPRST